MEPRLCSGWFKRDCELCGGWLRGWKVLRALGIQWLWKSKALGLDRMKRAGEASSDFIPHVKIGLLLYRTIYPLFARVEASAIPLLSLPSARASSTHWLRNNREPWRPCESRPATEEPRTPAPERGRVQHQEGCLTRRCAASKVKHLIRSGNGLSNKDWHREDRRNM